jgi:UMF1 family MFS transporter
MDICGKGASLLGASLIALVNRLTVGMEVRIFGLTLQNENLAVGSLIILFIIGFLLFCKADKLKKERMG